MVENTETKKTEKVEAPAKKERTKTFLFPREGISIEATNREEAEKLYKQTVKNNKE